MGSSSSKPSNDGIEQSSTNNKVVLEGGAPKGISVHCLKHVFLEEVKDQGLDETSTIYEIENLSSEKNGVIRSKGAHRIDLVDGRVGASYVSCLSGKDNVGPANFMLSYSWSYKIGDIVDTLCDFCQTENLDERRTYIWLCCICINQHRVVEKKDQGESTKVDTFAKFRDTFYSRVTGIGKVISMMSPWNKPVYLTRIWCVFELYTANDKNCEVIIAMPPREKLQMVNALRMKNGFHKMFQAMAGTSIQDANASVEMDRTRILNLVEQGPGFQILNNAVNDLLRKWVKKGVMEAVATRERESDNPSKNLQLATLCNQVAGLMKKNGEIDTAIELFQKSLAIKMNVYGKIHKSIGMAHHNIGWALMAKRDAEAAKESYQKSLDIKEELGMGDSVEAAMTISCLSQALSSQGKKDEALVKSRKAVEIFERELGTEHQHTATGYNDLSLLLTNLMQYSEAIEILEKSLKIYQRIYGEKHPETAAVYHNLGKSLYHQEYFTRSLDCFQKSLAIKKTVLGSDHSMTKLTQKFIDEVKMKL